MKYGMPAFPEVPGIHGSAHPMPWRRVIVRKLRAAIKARR